MFMKRPVSLYVLYVLHLLLIVSASAGGILMLVNPDGSLLGLEVSRLAYTPFTDYRLPGILLLLSNAIFPLLALVGLVAKPSWKSVGVLNIYPSIHWAWAYSLYTGIIVIVWITVQLLLTSYFWMHPVVIFLALLIILFTMIPANIRYFAEKHELW